MEQNGRGHRHVRSKLGEWNHRVDERQHEHGTSGGQWVTDFNGSPREYGNGLQSSHNHDGDFVEFTPYFTTDVKALWDWISDPANHSLRLVNEIGGLRHAA